MTETMRQMSPSVIGVPLFGTTVGLALCLTLLLMSQGLLFDFSLISYFYHVRQTAGNSNSDHSHDKYDFTTNNYPRSECAITCRLEIAESIPENVTFLDSVLPKSTFEAWKQLISLANTDLHIAAYKSSLRGKHVLEDNSPSTAWGEEIFDRLISAGRKRNVNIRMIENYPPRDKGDNEDGMSLERRGVVDRRPIHFTKIMGNGLMHSKFIIADEAHFYLGSANLDWRSLNQKMELGVLVTNCPCLTKDLKNIFYSYWQLTEEKNQTDGHTKDTVHSALAAPTTINMENPLAMTYQGEPLFVYLAASPPDLNGNGRTYDLDAIISIIEAAEKFIYIHVMDYIPMMVYRQPKRYWSVIDDALRRAVVERGVELKLISAALHFVPENLHFLKSLQSLGGVSKGSVGIKIFKIPVVTEFQSIIARDRRTHNKFMVTESSVVIGTSNWSGDYFSGTTGVQIVACQNGSSNNRPFIDEMRQIFIRDWLSPYAHSLSTYVNQCLYRDNGGDICEPIRRY